jgi:trigger factor
MAVNVETLEKLERRITLTLAADAINATKSSARLKKLARTVKADGFRPGKVPMSVVAQRYGYSVQYEVVNDRSAGLRRGRHRSQAARRRRAAHHAEGRGPEGQIAFDATFEVYPEVKLGDLAPRGRAHRHRGHRRRHRPHGRDPAQAAPQLRLAAAAEGAAEATA